MEPDEKRARSQALKFRRNLRKVETRLLKDDDPALLEDYFKTNVYLQQVKPIHLVVLGPITTHCSGEL